jgi:ribosome maturation factor RimP
MKRLKQLEEDIAPILEDLGFDIVRIAITGDNGRRVIQVMADKLDGSQIKINDCSNISKIMSEIFESDPPVEGDYSLEVSSAGIDRPLTRTKDFKLYSGYEAKIHMSRPIYGAKKFKGIIKGLSDESNILLEIDGNNISLPITSVEQAQLVLTDKLVEANRIAENER